jgi:hypothetical protein
MTIKRAVEFMFENRWTLVENRGQAAFRKSLVGQVELELMAVGRRELPQSLEDPVHLTVFNGGNYIFDVTFSSFGDFLRRHRGANELFNAGTRKRVRDDK